MSDSAGAAIHVALLAVVAVACRANDSRVLDRTRRENVRDSAVRSAAPSPDAQKTPAVASASDTGCPHWGKWRLCNVEYRLTRAGLVVHRQEQAVRHDFLSVPGTVYLTGSSEVQVFIYADSLARARDTNGLDTTTVSPPGRPVTWHDPATLVTSNNLAAIIISPNGRQSERIALALSAGMPLEPPGGGQ